MPDHRCHVSTGYLAGRGPLVDLSKLTIRDGRIHYFLYQQDRSKQPMSCPDTTSNRLFVAWVQIHDSPLTGNEGAILAGLPWMSDASRG